MEPAGTPIIFDNGSLTTRIGFGGYEAPIGIFNTDISDLKKNDQKGDHWTLKLSKPIKQGKIDDWEGIEDIWRRSFDALKVKSSEYPLLITEPAFNPEKNREKMTEIMFEKFKVPSLCGSLQCILSLFETGTMTGLVLDSGHEFTQVVPINQGYSESKGIKTSDIAGITVTEHLEELLKKSSPGLSVSLTTSVLKDIKEGHCYLALNPATDLGKAKSQSLKLPDGKEVNLEKINFQCSEPLFKPSLVKKDGQGLHELVCNAVKDSESGQSLFGQILLAGGNTMLQGFEARLSKDLSALIPAVNKAEVKINAPAKRNQSAWVGGSILSTLGSFPAMSIQRKEYEEGGAAIIHSKCPI